MKELISLINQTALLELKLSNHTDESILRILQRMKTTWADLGYIYSIPMNEKYIETRTDVVANIAGDLGEYMMITQVIKPIVYLNNQIVQQGVVIVEAKK